METAFVRKMRVVLLVRRIVAFAREPAVRPMTPPGVPKRRSWGVFVILCRSAARRNGPKRAQTRQMIADHAVAPVVIKTTHPDVKTRKSNPVYAMWICIAAT